MDSLEMEALASRIMRDESTCVECVLYALYISGHDPTRVCVTTIRPKPPELPGAEVHEDGALVARIRWRRAARALELRLWLRPDLRAAFARARVVLHPEVQA
jgi:hypothetical protein